MSDPTESEQLLASMRKDPRDLSNAELVLLERWGFLVPDSDVIPRALERYERRMEEA